MLKSTQIQMFVAATCPSYGYLNYKLLNNMREYFFCVPGLNNSDHFRDLAIYKNNCFF